MLTSDTVVSRTAPAPETNVRRVLQLYDPPLGHPAPRRRDIPRVELANHWALAKVLHQTRPDVVSVWHLGGVGLSLLRQLSLRRRPVVFVVADDWMRYAPGADPVISRMPRLLPDLARLGRVVFCSDALRRAVSAHVPWDVGRGSVVWLGVDAADFPMMPPDDRPWTWRVLYVGRLSSEKGIETAVRALAHLPAQATLDIVGRGERQEQARITAVVDDVGLRHRVRFAEADRRELAGRYRSADVLVFPSEWDEPFGIVPLEAMACATPVVATATGGAAEYLSHEENCLIVPVRDASALAAAVTRFADDEPLRRHVVQNGLHTAATITTDRLADELWSIHASVVAS